MPESQPHDDPPCKPADQLPFSRPWWSEQDKACGCAWSRRPQEADGVTETAAGGERVAVGHCLNNDPDHLW